MQGRQLDLQSQKNGTFYRPTVWSAQALLQTESYTDEGITCDYEKCFDLMEKVSHLARDNIFKPDLKQKTFITSNDAQDGYIDCTLSFLLICQQQDFASFQPIKVKLEFRPVVSATTKFFGYVLQMANENSIIIDGQRQFDFQDTQFFFVFPISSPDSSCLLSEASFCLSSKMFTLLDGIVSV